MRRIGLFGAFVLGLSFGLVPGCGSPTGNSNLTSVNTNSGVANSVSNSNLNAVSTTGSTVDTREPEQYQATVKLSLQTIGTGQQQANLPTLGANVARSGDNRVMEFTLPTNEKVIFLDKGGTNYLILPSRKQYAELTKKALGFEVRRMLMPEQIVQQVKGVPGLKLVGEETQNGRQVVKYAYQAVANTNTQAGRVETESYLLVDKETGLPLHSETISQSQTGNVQGVSGVRIVTDMTDIKTSPEMALFDVPSDYQKIDPETVRSSINTIFQVVSAVIAQAMKQTAPPANAVTPLSAPK